MRRTWPHEWAVDQLGALVRLTHQVVDWSFDHFPVCGPMLPPAV